MAISMPKTEKSKNTYQKMIVMQYFCLLQSLKLKKRTNMHYKSQNNQVKWKIYVLFLVLITASCHKNKEPYVYKSDTLKIQKITNNTFVHISYLDAGKFGKVACNGMIVIDNGEALIFDSPAYDSDAEELIHVVKNTLQSKIKGIIATHHHMDCVGGLNAFHNKNIPSYASFTTIELAKQNNTNVPQNGFENILQITVGNRKVRNEFVGEGHTKDNIISYIADEKILFGGCLIKSLKAKKGNLADANVQAWSKTVQKIKEKYKNVKFIIPGHGKYGGQQLLEYTIDLFKNP